MTPTLLLIEDDAALRRSLAQSFELEDITVIAASSWSLLRATTTPISRLSSA